MSRHLHRMKVWFAWLKRPRRPIVVHFLVQTFQLLLVMTGAAVGLYEAISVLFGATSGFVHEVEQVIHDQANSLLALMVGFALWNSWPRPFARVKIRGQLAIEVVVADLFEIKGGPDLVIGGNSRLITRTTGDLPLVSLNGVQGQFQQRFYYYPGIADAEKREAEEELEKNLRNQLGGGTGTDCEMGKVARIARFDKENLDRQAYYLVMAKPLGTAFDTSLPEVKTALTGLWTELINGGGDRNRIVAMHLLGTGVLGLAVSRQLMVMEMVDSLIEATYRPTDGYLKPLSKLIVAIHPDDYMDDDFISFYELQQHLNTLKHVCS